jgi:hypothetical protein
MTAPDFFLVGAPKCATSSLHKLLIQHPGIFMCRPKEPHFFSTDLPGLAEVPDRSAYDALFEDAPEGVLRGEASAFYLMSEDAARNTHAANPQARIVISLRDPAQAARSWYHQLRDGFREDQPSFEDAWALQAERAAGAKRPSYCPEPRQLQYGDVYAYDAQVARYLEVFGSDQVLILRFEDILRTPQQVVQNVLAFLGLPPFETDVTLPQTNVRRQARFAWLSQLIAAPPPLLRPLLGPTKWLLNCVGIKPSVVMMKHLSRPAKPSNATAPDYAFETMLRAHFASDVARLEKRLNVDLSQWRTGVGKTDPAEQIKKWG